MSPQQSAAGLTKQRPESTQEIPPNLHDPEKLVFPKGGTVQPLSSRPNHGAHSVHAGTLNPADADLAHGVPPGLHSVQTPSPGPALRHRKRHHVWGTDRRPHPKAGRSCGRAMGPLHSGQARATTRPRISNAKRSTSCKRGAIALEL